jgi:transcription antitermination factor NusG
MDRFNTSDNAWFAIQTRYRYEQRIADELKTKGIESFLPTVSEVHNWKDRTRILEVPAFSGYLFARFEATLENRVRVLETAGVVKLLGRKGKPEPVAVMEVSALRQVLESGMACTRHPYMATGTLLRIKRGPLQGLEGHVVRTVNALKIVLNVSCVYQAIAVEVALEDVEAVEFSSPAKSSAASAPSASLLGDWAIQPLSVQQNFAASTSRN